MIPALPVDLACPPTHVETGIRVETVATGFLTERRDRILDRGDLEGTHDMVHTVGLIHHPDGLVVVDSGLGTSTVEGRFPTFPLGILDITLPAEETLAARLTEAPDRFLLTHGHYDHVGGLTDFPETPIWLDSRELTRLWTQPGVPRRTYKHLAWAPQDLASGGDRAVLGRAAVDVMGDHSIWLLSTPGHTPGTAAVLVLTDNRPWLFLGDTAWVYAHLEDSRRPGLVSTLVDAEPDQLEDSLAWARWLYASCPDLVVVPGHEAVEADPRKSADPSDESQVP